jgi:hypothetical protein
MFYRSLHNSKKLFINSLIEENMQQQNRSLSIKSYQPRSPPPNIPYIIFGVVFFYLVIQKM